MIKISVIIPVYKVEDYIENSLISVCNQTFKDFEVLIVDNNSPDNSIVIAERILSSARINYRVVEQRIQGLPAARNMGIMEAKGEWLISIDPDDTIAPNFLDELYKESTSNSLDVVFSRFQEVDENHLFDFDVATSTDCMVIYKTDDLLNKLLTRRLPLMVSNLFIKKDVFKRFNLTFDEDVILGADLLLLWRLLKTQNQIGYINKPMYNHFFRSDSLITSPSSLKIERNLAGYLKNWEYYKSLGQETFGFWIYCRELYGLLTVLCLYGDEVDFMLCYNKYYTPEVRKSLQSFPDKKIRIMNVVLSTYPFLFRRINLLFRKPNSKIDRIIQKIIHN